jgi:predicted DNA-binding transcriptional regulator AlpA
LEATSKMSTAKKPAAQVEFSEKTAALKAANADKNPSSGLRLLSKPEVLEKIGVSYPCLWSWMRQGKFPRSRELHGKIAWLESEVDSWIANLPVRKLKGDAEAAS